MKQIQAQIRHEDIETPEVYVPTEFLAGFSSDVHYVATAQGSKLIVPEGDNGTEISLVDPDLETTEWPTDKDKAVLTDHDRHVTIDVRSL